MTWVTAFDAGDDSQSPVCCSVFSRCSPVFRFLRPHHDVFSNPKHALLLPNPNRRCLITKAQLTRGSPYTDIQMQRITKRRYVTLQECPYIMLGEWEHVGERVQTAPSWVFILISTTHLLCFMTASSMVASLSCSQHLSTDRWTGRRINLTYHWEEEHSMGRSPLTRRCEHQ